LSTEPRPRACGAGARRARGVATAVALSLACARRAPGTPPDLTELCAGRNVDLRGVTLIVDSVRPAAGAALRSLVGTTSRLDLAFRGSRAGGDCSGQGGRTGFEGELPPELASGTAGDRVALWRIENEAVVVDLAPHARDNNVTLLLPLRGGDGRWSYSTIVGPVASGRLRRGEAPR
jgi:hypothetical protein